MKRLSILMIVLLNAALAVSQTVIMPATGSGDTTMSYAVLYDDGGPNGSYSSTCNATYTFHTVSPTGRYRIQVSHNLTHPQGNACLTIGNGSSTGGTTIALYPGMASGEYFSSENSVTVSFVSDDDYPTSGFEIILCEYNGFYPTNIRVGFDDSTTMYIRWVESSTTITWILDYAIVDTTTWSNFFDNPSNYSTMTVDTNYVLFTDVPVGSHLVYRIYTYDTSDCPRSAQGSGQPWVRPTVCPCVAPQDLTITPLDDSIRLTWTPVDTVHSWHIIINYLSIDTFLDGTPTEFTFPYDYPCNSNSVYINGNCTTYCDGVTIYLPQGGCHQTVGSIRRVHTTGSTIDIEWNAVSDSSSLYLLYYRLADQSNAPNILLDTLPQNVTSYTVTGLQPHTRYTFTIIVLCGGTQLSCDQVRATISTTLDHCIDYINLLDVSNIHMTWGTYEFPTLWTVGGTGRHVAYIDTTQYDANTGYLLRCVPPGEEASLRLGDDNVGAEGETITYDYLVDSLVSDMLVLKFAIVMQNPNHTATNQPHFSMEILDGNGDIIDTNCCYADFAAAGDLGWNAVPNSNIIWKDWTTVGIDIAPYHGQNIKIRFTTKDCADGGHYGYAYLMMKCDSKRIALVNLCDSHDSVRLRAPEGFEYRWTRDDDTTVFSTVNEIVVPADSSEYRCHASFVGKPDCSFTVQSRAVLPVPLADMERIVDTCGRKAIYLSRCRVEIDSGLMQYVRQTIDSVRWVVQRVAGQSTTVDTVFGDTLTLKLTEDADYQVTLSCKLSNSDCGDQTDDSLTVDFVYKVSVSGDSVACLGDTITLAASVTPSTEVQYLWNSGDTAETISIATAQLDLQEYLYRVKIVDPYGCPDSALFPVTVHSVYDDTLVFDICDGLTFDTLGFHVAACRDSLPAADSVYLATLHLASRYGCDSAATLALTVHAIYIDTIVAAYCDSSYYLFDFEADTTGFYTNTFVSVYGCDSVRNLAFTRFPVFRDTIVEELYYGFSYTSHGFNESATGFYQMTYTDTNGCDSIYCLDLNVVYLQFPNAVTPNGDGVNDLLEIVGLLESHIFYYTNLRVYDRWGRLIYHKENLRHRGDFWDPNATGSPDGTYFYRFLARSPMKGIDHKSVIEVIR